MTDLESAAQKSGLRDLALLKLYPEDISPAVVIADLQGRFPGAFHDIRTMPRADYAKARTEMVFSAEQAARRREPVAVVDARTLGRKQYAAARQAMLQAAGR